MTAPGPVRGHHDAAQTTQEGDVIKEFRDFLFRGNIIELAVAVVIAAAFGRSSPRWWRTS